MAARVKPVSDEEKSYGGDQIEKGTEEENGRTDSQVLKRSQTSKTKVLRTINTLHQTSRNYDYPFRKKSRAANMHW